MKNCDKNFRMNITWQDKVIYYFTVEYYRAVTKCFSMMTEEILDQLESSLAEFELDLSNPLDHSNLREGSGQPPSLGGGGGGGAGAEKDGLHLPVHRPELGAVDEAGP